jgi:hypothetical protein
MNCEWNLGTLPTLGQRSAGNSCNASLRFSNRPFDCFGAKKTHSSLMFPHAAAKVIPSYGVGMYSPTYAT